MRTSPPTFGSSRHRPPSRGTNQAQQLEDGLQHVNIPAWIISYRGVFTWLNDTFIELFGNRIGEHYSSIVAPQHRNAVDVQFTRKLNGARGTEYEIEAVTKNGRLLAVEVRSVRLNRTSSCGAVFGLAVVGKPVAPSAERARLTPRQLEILRLLARGASTSQIAGELFLSRETVRNHVRGLLRALGAHTRLEAVVKARRLGLIPE